MTDPSVRGNGSEKANNATTIRLHTIFSPHLPPSPPTPTHPAGPPTYPHPQPRSVSGLSSSHQRVAAGAGAVAAGAGAVAAGGGGGGVAGGVAGGVCVWRGVG